MAESADGQEKTEDPSGKRLSEMLERGDITRSQEVGVFVGVLSSLVGLAIYGESFGKYCGAALRGVFHFQPGHGLQQAQRWSHEFMLPVFGVLLQFILLVFVSAIAASMAQTGLVVAWKALEPKYQSVSPMSGLKRLFSMQTTVQLIKNVLKVVVIGWIVYDGVSGHISEVVGLSGVPLMQALGFCAQLIMALLVRVCIFLAVLAAADYGYQWFSHRKKSLMTKQEMKDEMKQQEVSPHVKGRVRQIAMERSKRRIQAEVPTADVVVTNPTHFAVAIRYKRGEEVAPRVVAKGQDRLAKVMRELAKEHDVPLYEYPELARALYRQVKEGSFVPFEMYESVARVLAYIYRVNQRKTGS